MYSKDIRVEIINYTKGKPLSGLPFVNIKNEILGIKYNLSILLVGEKRARTINIKTRKKTYTPSTLSLPYTKSSGDIIICEKVAAKECKNYQTNLKNYIAYLYIHSLLHLKGLDHGQKMTSEEKRLVNKYRIRIKL